MGAGLSIPCKTSNQSSGLLHKAALGHLGLPRQPLHSHPLYPSESQKSSSSLLGRPLSLNTGVRPRPLMVHAFGAMSRYVCLCGCQIHSLSLASSGPNGGRVKIGLEFLSREFFGYFYSSLTNN